MIRVKKNFVIDTSALLSRMKEGFYLKSFQIMHNGNVAMIFECPLEDDNFRYVIKIHNRVGIQRQSSFTAAGNRVLKMGLWGTEFYAVLASVENEKELTFMRVEPDMREDFIELPEGKLQDLIVYSKESIMTSFEDGRIIYFEKRKPFLLKETPGDSVITMDRNSRFMWLDGYNRKLVRRGDNGTEEFAIEGENIEAFLMTGDGRSVLTFENGRVMVYTKEDGVFRNPQEQPEITGEQCIMSRDNIGCLAGDKIIMYKIF